ncbi:MAG: protein kinase [Bernardetiaceae bacterium]|nr:protein kinase [Bernardetiaceae bacterium]
MENQDPNIGRQILNYEITHQVGEGGMAKVYAATHTSLGSKVAIKLLNPEFAKNDSLRSRFKSEAQTVAAFSHPNIINVVDYYEDEDTMAIVSELLEGQDLNAYLKTRGSLDATQAADIFKKILSGFAYAHDRNVVHRDVKPSNIFFTDGGDIKIMDFGIAKLLDSADAEKTKTGMNLGTPIYMSPEQVKDSKRIDKTSDIYSLGVTFYVLLTGKKPYDSQTESNFEIQTKIVTEPLPRLPHHCSEFQDVINKATAKNPEHRFQSCEEFMEALESPYNYSNDDDATVIDGNKAIFKETTNLNDEKITASKITTKEKNNYILPIIIGVIVSLVIIVSYIIYQENSLNQKQNNIEITVDDVEETSNLAQFTPPDGKWTINNDLSTIKWTGYKVIGDPHNGSIQIKRGTLTIKDSKISKGEFIINMTTIKNLDMEDENYRNKIEGHLASSDFFDVNKFPEATFSIDLVEPYEGIGTSSSIENPTHKIIGRLSIRDKTEIISFSANFETDGDRSEIMIGRAIVTIDRTKWGVMYGNEDIADLTKDKMIKNEMTLNIYLLAHLND